MTHIKGIAKTHSRSISELARLADSVIIGGSLLLMFAVSHAEDILLNHYLILALASIIIFQLYAELTNLYSSFRSETFHIELRCVWKTWIPAFLTVLAIGFALKRTTTYSRILITIWGMIVPILLSLVRAATRTILWKLREVGMNYRVAAICGASKQGYELARTLQNSPSFGIKLLGCFFDNNLEKENIDYFPCAGSIDDIVEKTEKGEVDIVYLALPLSEMHRLDNIIRKLSNSAVNLYVVPSFEAYDLFQSPVSNIGNIPVLSVFDTPLQGIDGMVKRIEDLALGIIALLLTGIPMLVIATAIKLTSRGPALFVQQRYGIDGKPINILKFRTMSVCETSEENIIQASKEDARITKFGAFLRKTSLDELPQLFNVLCGTMSLVGPRPHAVAHNELYRTQIHGYMLRHKIKPGITGLAQVRGFRGETDTLEKMEKRVECDLEYIRTWSITLDIKILVATIFVGFVHKNAY